MSIMSLTLSLVFPLLGKIMREINSAAFDFFFFYTASIYTITIWVKDQFMMSGSTTLRHTISIIKSRI